MYLILLMNTKSNCYTIKIYQEDQKYKIWQKNFYFYTLINKNYNYFKIQGTYYLFYNLICKLMQLNNYLIINTKKYCTTESFQKIKINNKFYKKYIFIKFSTLTAFYFIFLI